MDNLCMGTAQLGMSYGIANKTGQPEKQEVRKMVKTALDHGITFFDTAASYGNSESILGDVFLDLGVQKKVNVITKLPPDFVFCGIDGLRQTLARSLLRLGVESLRGVMLHRAETEVDQGFVSALARLKQEGVLEQFGVSIYSPDDALKHANEDVMDMIQAPFNIMDRRLLDNGFFEKARSKGKTIFIRSVFLQGLLLMDESAIREKKMHWTLPFTGKVRDFVENPGRDAKAFMIQAVRRKVPEAKLVMGMDNHRQLIENIALFQENTLPESCFEAWWDQLSGVPERLVNPALW